MKKKVLEVVIVAFSAFILLDIGIAIGVWGNQYHESHKPTVQASTATSTPDVYGIWKGVNNVRSKAGAQQLSLNAQLNQAAKAKCHDMVARDYDDHVAPDGKQPWYFFITQSGYKYQTAGENIATNEGDDAKTISAWMSSPGHKENILRSEFNETGIAICHSNNLQHQGSADIVVQEFAKRY